MTNLYFEELQIGSHSAAGPYLLSRDEIIRFATQYDPIPRHIDEEVAARSAFGGLTASGSHTFAIFILLTGQLQPHFQVLMGLGWDEVRLPNPVRPGDELDLEMTVLEMRESKSKSDRVSFAIEISCAIRSVKRFWNVSPIYSLRGGRKRTCHPHGDFRCWHQPDMRGRSDDVRSSG
jgi:acyl dehydratase